MLNAFFLLYSELVMLEALLLYFSFLQKRIFSVPF